MSAEGRTVIVNATLRRGQKLALAVDAAQRAFGCAREEMRLALWPADGVETNMHVAAEQALYTELAWALPRPWGEEAGRAANVVVASDALADSSIVASGYVGSVPEGQALQRTHRGPLIEWGPADEGTRFAEEAIALLLAAHLPEAPPATLAEDLECEVCGTPLRCCADLCVHASNAWALCCHACARHCPECSASGDGLLFPAGRHVPLDGQWCRPQQGLSSGGTGDDEPGCFLLFRASPLTWEEEALAPGAAVPWRAEGCVNCDHWGTHAVHSAFLHVFEVRHAWTKEAIPDDHDRQMSATTQCATALLRAERAGLHLHIVAVPAARRCPPWTVDLSSPAAREVTLPSEWRQNWCRACRLDPAVLAYGEHWGDVLAEVILNRGELPRAVSVPTSAFTPKLLGRLRERLPFACVACCDALETASREEAAALGQLGR